MEYKRRRGHTRPVESAREYKKLALIIAGILLTSSTLTWLRGWELNRFMGDFMATFFITFATFKLVNIEVFAMHYRLYDIIAKRFPVWGYVFPFVEAILGFAYLLSSGSFALNSAALLVTGISAVGVWRELQNRSEIMCACLGDVIRLPLSRVSFLEDIAMFVMALLMQLS